MAKNRLTAKKGNSKRRRKSAPKKPNEWLQNQRTHVRRRASQRYDIDLSRADLNLLVERIERGKAILLQRDSDGADIFLISYRGKRLPVVYDNKRKNLVTILPEKPRFISPSIMKKAHKALDRLTGMC